MEPKAHRRRWLQYGIRTLLVLMLVAGLFFTWVRYQRKVYADQRQALEQITQLGGQYATERRSPAWMAWLVGEDYVTVSEINFTVKQIDPSGEIGYDLKPQQLECLRRIPTLRKLSLSGVLGVEDGVTEHLRNASELQFLNLVGADLTDESAANLARLTELEELLLDETKIGDASIDRLKGLSKLKTLSLTGTRVSPTAATALSTLPCLEMLAINAEVPCQGIVSFSKFPKLRELKANKDYFVDVESNARKLVISDNPSLQTLHLDLPVDGMSELRRLPSLKEFRLLQAGAEIRLEDVPQLEVLTCAGTDTLVYFAKCQETESDNCRFLSALGLFARRRGECAKFGAGRVRTDGGQGHMLAAVEYSAGGWVSGTATTTSQTDESAQSALAHVVRLSDRNTWRTE